MAPKKKNGIVDKLLAKFRGSGDPEIADAKDVCAYFEEEYSSQPRKLKALMEGVLVRVQQHSPTWKPTWQLTVPNLAVDETFEGWCAPWHLGFTQEHAFRGKTKTVHCLEITMSFLDKTYDSQQCPLSIAFPHGAQPGTNIADFSMVHAVGFTRSMACKIILEGIALLQLSTAEFVPLVPCLQSLLCMKYKYTLRASGQESRRMSLRSKFAISESVRPDAMQISHNVKRELAQVGKEFTLSEIDKYIKDYNEDYSSGVEGYKISDLEAKIIKLLAKMTKLFWTLIEYHYQVYKSAESAVPLMTLAQAEETTFKVPDGSKEGVFAQIYEFADQKADFWLSYLVTVFARKIKEALRRKQKPNLRTFSSSFRVSDPNLAYNMCCIYVHFRP